MNGRDLPKGSIEERAAKVAGKGLNIYFTEGFSPKFLKNLEKFSMWLWRKYARTGDFEEYYDEVLLRVYEKLSSGVYDPAKASLTTYVFSVARNVASSFNSKGLRVTTEEPDFDRIEAPSVDEDLLDQFVKHAADKGLLVDKALIHHDLMYTCVGPVSEAFKWFSIRNKNDK